MTMFTPNSSPFKARYHFVSPSFHNSLYEFNVNLENHVSKLCSSSELLYKSPAFSRFGYSRPIDCDRAIETLDVMQGRIDEIAAQLKSIDRMQALFVPNYYRLMSKLYAANEKLLKIRELLINFRSICMKKNAHQQRFLRKIQDKLLIITQVCRQIQSESEKFLDTLLMNMS